MAVNGPSAHFSWKEFSCHDGTPYPVQWRNTRAKRLADVLEGLRAHLGGHPLQLGSVYRTPVWNRQNGGARKSQHPQGRAADPHPPLLPPSGVKPDGTFAGRRRMPLRQFHAKVREYVEQDDRVGGLGFYVWGVHVDVRPRTADRLIVWNQVPARTRLHDRTA